MTKSFTKIKHQIKSNMYYVFWGACTVAVMAGQIYVGTGYRSMQKTIEESLEKFIEYSEWRDKNRQFLLLAHKP